MGNRYQTVDFETWKKLNPYLIGEDITKKKANL
jgi:hypothetical protein